nr:hypothetical protein Iba_chr10fCG1650 [Ipomoea batatas]
MAVGNPEAFVDLTLMCFRPSPNFFQGIDTQKTTVKNNIREGASMISSLQLMRYQGNLIAALKPIQPANLCRFGDCI